MMDRMCDNGIRMEFCGLRTTTMHRAWQRFNWDRRAEVKGRIGRHEVVKRYIGHVDDGNRCRARRESRALCSCLSSAVGEGVGSAVCGGVGNMCRWNAACFAAPCRGISTCMGRLTRVSHVVCGMGDSHRDGAVQRTPFDRKDMNNGRDLDEPTPGFDSIDAALEAMRQGRPVVVLDDEDRENEGDLIVPADRVTAETIAFIVEHTSGVICVGMTGNELDRLKIPLMIPAVENEEAMSTAFTITVDLREGTTTGISAADRTATIRALANAATKPEDFKRPGHIFPLRCREGGVLTRPGHTEASVDLSQLAGCAPAGVLCEIVNKDGTMARTPELLEFSKLHGLPCITIADLVRYKLKNDTIVRRTASGILSTRYGPCTAYSYTSILDGQEHVALVFGSGSSDAPILVRVQNESILGDVFGSEKCGCGSQLDESLKAIAHEGTGVLVYLRGRQGKGMGIEEELVAFHGAGTNGDAAACDFLQEEDGGFADDLRDYAVAAHIIKDLGVRSIHLLTNNSVKAECLGAHGLHIRKLVPLSSPPPSTTSKPPFERGQHEPHFV